jgi:hypothetical protein
MRPSYRKGKVMTIHSDTAFLCILVFVIVVVASSITYRLKQIVGQLENANETLASILEEVEK